MERNVPQTVDPENPSRRQRIARRIQRLRHDVRRYRRLSIGFGAAFILATTVAAALALQADEPEAVYLGTGVAGVEGVESEGEIVDVPADVELPEPPPIVEEETGETLGEGSASYYHDSLEGRSTASGEAYRGAGLTAAHRTLPFGSRVRVTNVANDRAVVVRINDRGPFAHGRVIDLSRSAASQVGLLSRGHGRVRLELIR